MLFYYSIFSILPPMHLLWVNSKFWIGTSTEAHNQPHFLVDYVTYLSAYCDSFESLSIRLGFKNIFLFYLDRSHCRLCVIVDNSM